MVVVVMPIFSLLLLSELQYARFILMFCEVAKTVLPPAMMDVREGNYELLSKQAYISHDYVDIKIKTSEAHNGIERVVSMTMDDERKTKTVFKLACIKRKVEVKLKYVNFY